MVPLIQSCEADKESGYGRRMWRALMSVRAALSNHLKVDHTFIPVVGFLSDTTGSLFYAGLSLLVWYQNQEE